MADTGNPLERGPVVGTELKENIAEGYQKLGNVVQEPFKPGVTGDMVYQQAEARAQAITALASGVEKGLSPLIDGMITNYKQQSAGSDYAAGAAAGLAGSNAPGAGSLEGIGGAAQSGSPVPAAAPGGPGEAPTGSSPQIARGSDGISSVIPGLSSLFGGGGAGYSKSYGAGLISASETADSQAAVQLRAKYTGDPEGFKGAWDAYVQGRNYGAFGNEYGTKANLQAISIGGQHYNSMVTQKASQDVIASGQAVKSQIGSVSNDMSALARGGQMGSQQFDELQDKLQDLYGQLNDNPGLAKPEGKSYDDQLKERLNSFQADNIVGRVDDAQRNGGASAAKKAVGDAIDKIPGLSDTERAQFLQQGEARIRYNEGINKDETAINLTAFNNIKEKIKAGDRSPDVSAALDGVIATAGRTGDHVLATDAGYVKTSLKAMPAGLSPSEVRGSAGTAPVGDMVANANAIKRIESAGSGGYSALGPVTKSGDRAYGAYQVMGNNIASWTQAALGHSMTSQEFLNDPKAQDAVFNHQFGLYIQKFGNPQDAASAWFTGRPISASSAAARDLGGKGTSGAQYVALFNKYRGLPAETAPPNVQTPEGGIASTTSEAPGRTTPFTDEQLRANPGLYASYTDLAAGDMENRKAAAEAQGPALETAISNHTLPAPEALAQYTQLAQDIPGEQDKLARITGGAMALAEKGGGGVGGGFGPSTVPGGGGSGTYKDQVAAMVAGKGDLFAAGVAAAHDKMLDEEASFAKSHPIEYAARKGWALQPPPINFQDPNSVAQGFRANAQITNAVTSREPGVSLSAIPENQKPQVNAWLANGPSQSAQAILDGIAALPPAARDATVSDMKDSILGMAKSGDPTKMEAAHSLMDQVWRASPITFEGKMGKDALSDLRAWQDKKQFMTPEQLAKDAMTANDPNVVRAREGLKDQADTLLKPVTGKTIVDGMVAAGAAGTVARWNPFRQDYSPISDAPAQSLGAVREDYADAYRHQFGQTGDATAADNYAKEIVASKWTFSPTNGGRLTAFAPETSPAYPQVNGSRTYIGDQLNDFMIANGHGGAQAYLVPDGSTEAEIKSGAAPGYRVVALGNDGQYAALPKTARFYANPKAAQARANEDFETANRPTAQGGPIWGGGQ